MSPQETLQREHAQRNRQMVIALAAAVLLLVAAVLELAGLHAKVDEATLDLLVENKRFPLDLIAAILNALASLAIASTLLFLYQAARARNPDRVRPWLRIITIVGGVASAVGGIAYAVLFAIAVHEFATTGSQTYTEATHLPGAGILVALQLIELAAALLIALAFVLVSLQAMNVGLLPRAMGYLGMFAGALVLFQVFQLPVIQCGWLLAVAYLISGRWPNEVPPAWRTGQAEPWPSSAEMRTRRAAAAGARGSRGGRGGTGLGAPEPQPAGAPAAAATADGRTRATTPKRKRKRRN